MINCKHLDFHKPSLDGLITIL